MAGIVHALLVGIDQYPHPAHRLAGCRNDVEEFHEVLKLRVPPAGIRLATLIDNQATRATVIDTFRQHLGQAAAGDTALFYYAGHGSRECAPEAFWTIEPDRLDETLVLFDSRETGGWDLADKELAVLIRQVAKSGAHVVVILDSCHSGSGTRKIAKACEEKVRRFPPDVRDRPLDSFLPEVQTVASARTRDSGWDLGDDGRHILLAACCDDQEATEYNVSGKKRGAFSYFLVEALRETPGTLTYRDLASGVRARVMSSVHSQTPQVEATIDADLDRAFLGDAIQPRVHAFVAIESEGAWWIDGGRIHGVPLPASGEFARIALFGEHVTQPEMAKVSQATALGDVVEVEATRSCIRLTRGDGVLGVVYKAILLSAPLPTRTVRLTGASDAVAAAHQAMEHSVFVAEAEADADYVLECADGKYRLRRAVDDHELTVPSSSADEAVRNLEHITRWRYFAELDNPVSAIEDSEFEVKVFSGQTGSEELSGTDVRLTATRDENGLIPPTFRVSFRNRGTRDLYFGLLALDELFACSTDLVKAGVMRLGPGDEAGWALDGKALKSSIPQVLRDEGRTESRDILKTIVSTRSFEIRHAGMQSLGGARGASQSAKVVNTLERLLVQGQTRTISAASEGDEISDFRTRTVIITTVEPRASVKIEGTAPVDIGAGVRVETHPMLRACARLTSMEQTRSDMGTAMLPPMFRTGGAGETVSFTLSRGSAPALSVLELCDVSDHTAVTPEAPLRIHLPVSMLPGDVILPVGYDGEDYLILGHGGARAGDTVVSVSRLPHPVGNRVRSLTGSIKILFQKFAAPILGANYRYPLLAAAQWDADSTVHYETEAEVIRTKIGSARRVVVFVHGIIGDTRSMGARITPRTDDVFLAFDYENLHTTIEKNAEGLRERLIAYGLGDGNDKEVILVAHSMGGLVARWFTEKLGGRKIVSQVILCGTPNAGSNWATAEDWVTGAASLALNHLTKISWEAATVGALFWGLEKIDNTLDQMKPGSTFLRALAELDDPQIPYTILAGNTSLASAADGSRVQRLLKKVLYRTTSLVFLFEPNDIAVSVKSISTAGLFWKLKPDVQEVACDHVSYFSCEAGTQELRALLKC